MLRAVLLLPEVRRAGLALIAFAVAVPADLLGAPWPVFAVPYALCYVLGGWAPAWSGLRALRERSLDVDLLMLVAALGAAAIGQYLDGALLIVIFAGSGALEAAMTTRVRAAITGLLDLAPQHAVRLRAGREEPVPAAALAVGDEVLVRPGEPIPADGRIESGSTEIDTAGLTGEPLPVPRGPGDPVHAGTVNGTGMLRVRVERDPAQSVIAGIAEQVRRAAETKSRRQLFVERVEQRYSVLVVVSALALFLIPLLAGADLRETLLRAMTFMIVASPCAVILATMPPLLAAIAVAGRRGVLVKEATVVEALSQVDAVALDKTGTLTEGRPHVRAVEPLGGYLVDTVVALAAAVESGSEHVLGRAVVAEARRRGLDLPRADEVTALPGRGVRGLVAGHTVVVGRPDTLANPDDDWTVRGAREAADGTECEADALGGPEPGLMISADPEWEPRSAGYRAHVASAQQAGDTAVVVWVDGEPAGVLTLADRLREGAVPAVAALGSLVGPPALLTGDAAGPAAAVGAQLGISDVHAGLLPADKAATVERWQREGRSVLAVGDGLNDAPLLATADVGLAVRGSLGEGASGLSVSAADGVLLRDPLTALAPLVALCRRARRIARANLTFAAVVIVTLVGWDLFGTLPLALGVAGHELSTVLVCLNGLRLLANPAWPTPTRPKDRR